MFFQATILIAIFLAFTRPESGGDIALASIMVVFSSMFYVLMFNAMSGQKEVGLDLDADLNHLWQNRVISIAGMVALYKIEMFSAFYFALPFQLIALCCDLLATGFKIGVLEVERVDPDELPEEEDDKF